MTWELRSRFIPRRLLSTDQFQSEHAPSLTTTADPAEPTKGTKEAPTRSCSIFQFLFAANPQSSWFARLPKRLGGVQNRIGELLLLLPNVQKHGSDVLSNPPSLLANFATSATRVTPNAYRIHR